MSARNDNRAAILTVDIENLKDDFPAPAGYTTAFLIFRFRDIVVSQAFCPVRKGVVTLDEVRQLIKGASRPVWNELVRPKARPFLPTATVAVCTRDRPADLATCLASLLPLAEEGHEVLIIDNCPSDARTAELVGQYRQIRYVLEPKPGLDRARNRALLEARGEVVAFTDDDAWVEQGWLAALLENFEDPMVAVVTGMTLPAELDTEAQCWFERTNGFGRGFHRQVFDSANTLPLSAGRVGAGVNMAIRRSALPETGLFNLALDGGTASKSGGDQEFFYRTLNRGFRIVYEPRAVVHHRHRREWVKLRETIYGYGVGVFAWWTSALIEERETTLVWHGSRWFIQSHVANLVRSLLRRPGSFPLDLAWAEFRGALAGPFSYLRARRQLERSPHTTGVSDEVVRQEKAAYDHG